VQRKVLSDISPDGSERSFTRVVWKGMPAIEIGPAPGREGFREALSFYQIGCHLLGKNVPVPEIYHFDRSSGVLVVQDLGSTMFFDRLSVLLKKHEFPSVKRLYSDVLEVLLLMQVRGGVDFDTSWCWQDGTYDQRVAREKEAGYFLEAFVKGYMGCNASQEVIKELDRLVDHISHFTCNRFFMHRDFQSRNIMLSASHPKGMAVIDFQAGRLGPLGYDLASLLNDPYIDLDHVIRKELFETYIKMLEKAGMVKEAEEVVAQWPILSALRLMQALGAFGFLTQKRARPFFHSYVTPALCGLTWILENDFPLKMPCTVQLCHFMQERLSQRKI